MKYKLIFPMALLSLIALLCTGCRRDDARAVYDRYVVREELHVIFVKDFRMDSIRGDFVILEAPDTATWFALAKEFGIPRSMAQGTSSTIKVNYISHYQDRKDPTQWAPKITLPSGEKKIDFAQSCKLVVDVIHQCIYLIFADDEMNFRKIDERITGKFKSN